MKLKQNEFLWLVADMGGGWAMRNAKTEAEARETLNDWLLGRNRFGGPIPKQDIQVFILNESDKDRSTNENLKRGEKIAFSVGMDIELKR